MKKTIHLSLWAATALMGISLSGLWAADTTPPATTDSYRQAGSPTNVNKASSLIGMEVRNQNDEKLGKIEDIVVDLNSGKIAYAVLNAGNLFKTKYLAVPVTAFAPSADQKHLTLTADKAKLESAKGFEKNMWPSVSNPDWGADMFWETRPGTTTLPSDTDRNRIDERNRPIQPPARPSDK